MGRKALCLFLAHGLLAGQTGLSAQTAADSEVAKGIKQVEEGDHDAGIFTLDAAVRRLARTPGLARELSQAYLYLGIAYLGKGHETLAKARFKDALTHDKSLSLEPERYAPRVLELFEKAREESATAASGGVQPPAKKKGGSKTGLVLLGVGGVAAAGIALAAGGGGAAGASQTATDTRKTETVTGVLVPILNQGHFRDFAVIVAGTGVLDATLTWNEPAAILSIRLYQDSPSGANIGVVSPTGTPLVRLSAAVTAGTYGIGVFQCIPANPCPGLGTSTSNATFSVTVIHP